MTLCAADLRDVVIRFFCVSLMTQKPLCKKCKFHDVATESSGEMLVRSHRWFQSLGDFRYWGRCSQRLLGVMTTEKPHLCTHKLVLTSEGSIWDFLTVQWAKNHLPMKWTRAQYLIWEIPHSAGQLNLCAVATESCSRAAASASSTLEPALCSKRSHHTRSPQITIREQSLLSKTRESWRTATKTQCS